MNVALGVGGGTGVADGGGVVAGGTAKVAVGDGMAAEGGVVPQPDSSKTRVEVMIIPIPLPRQELKALRLYFSVVTVTSSPRGTGWCGAALLPPAAGPASGRLPPPADHVGDGKQLLRQGAAALRATGCAACRRADQHFHPFSTVPTQVLVNRHFFPPPGQVGNLSYNSTLTADTVFSSRAGLPAGSPHNQRWLDATPSQPD